MDVIDTLTAGMRDVTAGFLIDAPRPTLIECGPALTIQHVLDALDARGLDADDLRYLVLTHIHLDHAGGAGDVAAAFPAATIVVSDLGARHLADPERLNASSRRAYGPLFDEVYGPCTPIEAERILAVEQRTTLDLGAGRQLELLATPGHAKHHMSAIDHDTGALFVGDSIGVKMPGMTHLRPATPPPDFDLRLTLRTIERYRELDPSTIYLAHYSDVGAPEAVLDAAEDAVRSWFSSAESAWEEHDELDHVVETLAARFGRGEDTIDDDVDPALRDDAVARVELLSGVRSNATGLVRYLELRRDDRLPDPDEIPRG